MLFVNTQTETQIQKFKMNGFKFFDAPLNFFHLDLKENPNPIPASAIAVYIGLHSICEADGSISPQIGEKHFNISKFAEKMNMPYSTISTGFNELISRNLVTEVLIGDEGKEVPVYNIRDYDALNGMSNNMPILPTDKKSNEGIYNAENAKGPKIHGYFSVPFELMNTNVLANLVKKRDRRGLIELLQLFSGFTRDLNRKSKEKLDSYVLPRNIEGLKTRLNRSAAKIREFFDIISPIFKVDFNFSTRNPVLSRLTRIRKAVKQIWVRQFKIRLSEKCVVENDDFTKTREHEALLRDEATHRLRALGYAPKKAQSNGIKYAFKDEVMSIAQYIDDLSIKHHFMEYAMTDALDQLENYTKNVEKVKNPGGFLRTKFKEAWIYYRDNHLTSGMRIDIGSLYNAQNDGETAPFMTT